MHPSELKDAQIKALERQVGELTMQLGMLQQTLVQRIEPTGVALIDLLNAWCQMVESQAPSAPVAHELIKKWVAANRRAEVVAAKLTVVRSPNGAQ